MSGRLFDGAHNFARLLRYGNAWILTPDTSATFEGWRRAPHERIYEPFRRCGCLRWSYLLVQLLIMTDGGRDA